MKEYDEILHENQERLLKEINEYTKDDVYTIVTMYAEETGNKVPIGTKCTVMDEGEMYESGICRFTLQVDETGEEVKAWEGSFLGADWEGCVDINNHINGLSKFQVMCKLEECGYSEEEVEKVWNERGMIGLRRRLLAIMMGGTKLPL